MAQHAAALQGDATRLAVGGDSAGGNLAAVVALRARHRGTPALCYQMLVYPATDMRCNTASHRANGTGYLLTREAIAWFIERYVPAATDLGHPELSPLRAADLHGLPPALMVTAEFDPLRDEGEAYAARLQEAGVPVELRRYQGMIHGFFNLGAVLDQGRQVVADCAAALRRAFAGQTGA